jgi:adenine phosphoribosyltransferase
MASRSATDPPLDGEALRSRIREVPDFPRPGIRFFDLATLFRDARALSSATRTLAAPYGGRGVDVVAGIEARGFVLGAAIALEIGAGFVMVRKLGKLPGATTAESYQLEYGRANIEIQQDAVRPGQRVLIVDDLLATGGTSAATGRLIERAGGRIVAFAFLVELAFLGGRARLDGHEVLSVVRYDRADPGL